MFIKNWKKDILTIPNLMSLFRLFLIPVYISIYLTAKNALDHYLAAGILAASCLTDLLDGKIARQFNMVTTFGKILDPLADKATQFSMMLCLAIKYHILWYLVSLFIIKEGFQLIAGSVNLCKGRMLHGALFSGKLCTGIIFLSLILLVMHPNLHAEAVLCIVITDICFMLISLGNYLFTYFTDNEQFESIDSAPND